MPPRHNRRPVPVRLSEEDQLQRALVLHWQARMMPNTILAAIPNGGQRAYTTAVRMKITGALAGMPDLLCIAPEDVFFIEMKKPGGRQTKEQKAISATIGAAGCDVFVIDDLDEGIALLEQRGLIKPQASLRAA